LAPLISKKNWEFGVGVARPEMKIVLVMLFGRRPVVDGCAENSVEKTYKGDVVVCDAGVPAKLGIAVLVRASRTPCVAVVIVLTVTAPDKSAA
jgi:hypothetical protein